MPSVLWQRIVADIHPFLEMHDWALRIALLVCTSIPVSRKKFLTFGASTCFGRWNGLVARTSTLAPWSDPTLSARCDGSQLLLGLALRKEGSPIEDYPRHRHQSCVWRFGCAVCRNPGVISIRNPAKITSYRLPLVLNKKGYKYMLPARSWTGRDGLSDRKPHISRNTIRLHR
jgi:hypothetical protein